MKLLKTLVITAVLFMFPITAVFAAGDTAASTSLDLTQVVLALIGAVVTIVGAFASYAMRKYGRNSAFLREEGVRNAILGAADMALSWAQSKADTYVNKKGVSVDVKNRLIKSAAERLIAAFPQYTSELKLTREQVTAILERRLGEIEQSVKAGVPVPSAVPNAGASNAAPAAAVTQPSTS